MNIQEKLSYTYIVLLSIGVIVISAYAIYSIRSFLLEEAITNFEDDASAFATSIEGDLTNEQLYDKANFVSEITGFNVALFDSLGNLIVVAPATVQGMEMERDYLNEDLIQQISHSDNQVIVNDPGSEVLISFHKISKTVSDARYIRISQLKSDLYGAESSIRHLIYGAMIGSILVVVIVSIFFARYLARPIRQLQEAALDIAEGNLDREINVNRNDEFGLLAESLNQMAGNLKADNEKLKSLNEKQNQFFADITHEVRNPLHTISGALEMLTIPSLPDDKKSQYMATAQKQVERVVRLFEDIKSLQRYDYDDSFINKSVFDVGSVIKEVVTTYKPIATEKGLELSYEWTGEHNVVADRDKIEQVIDNLVSNAVKYTAEGSIQVFCENNGKDVQIKVVDSGIGIGKEHLDRLFDRFYRTDKARSRDKGGTGLGLAVVKGILNAHQRDIVVDSTPGEGSSFCFTLESYDD